MREIGHSIATEYSLTYETPRPIEDGTNRSVELEITFNGETATANTSYQVRGIGGAAINEPEGGGAAGANAEGTGLAQFAFKWWNGAVPLLAILGLFGLSRIRFGVSTEELKAIVEAQSRPMPAAPAQRAAARAPSAPISPRTAPPSPPTASSGAGESRGARLQTMNAAGPVAAEYALLKDEVTVGRGEDNDIVIPHASISRSHARLLRRDGGFELMDLNSTNGTFVDEHPVHGSAFLGSGSEVRLGDIKFVLRF